MIEAGKYKARPVKWGVKTASTGTEQAVITFDVSDNAGKKHELTWFGSFKEGKAREITLKAIAACGCDDIAYFDSPQGLKTDQDVNVTIEIETNEKGTFPRIKWVNPVGGKFENMMAPAQSKSFLKSLKAEYAEVKKEVGGGAPSKGSGPKPPELDEDDDFNLDG